MNMITYFNELVTKNFNNYLKNYFNNIKNIRIKNDSVKYFVVDIIKEDQFHVIINLKQ